MRVIGAALQAWWAQQAALQVLAPGGLWSEEAPAECQYPVVIWDAGDPVETYNSQAKLVTVAGKLIIAGISSDTVEVCAGQIAAQLERPKLVLEEGWTLRDISPGEASATKLQTERDIWVSTISLRISLFRLRSAA